MIRDVHMEEFMSVFVRRCLEFELGKCELDISSQSDIFSSIFFASSLSNPGIAGGITIKTKTQDFSVSRRLYIKIVILS